MNVNKKGLGFGSISFAISCGWYVGFFAYSNKKRVRDGQLKGVHADADSGYYYNNL